MSKRHIIRRSIKATITKDEAGQFVFVASDETLDRQGEVVKADEWDLTQFTKSPRLLVDHDYRVQSIVGLASKIWLEGKTLKFIPQFHEITELAVMTKKMIEEGMLDTVSVGFCRRMSNGKGINELMEISFVAVPANANARLLAAKSIGDDDAGKIKEFIKGGAEGAEEGEDFVDHVLTEEDLANNPDLIEEGLKVGDVVGLPAEAEAIIQAGVEEEGDEEETVEEAKTEEVAEAKPEGEEKAVIEVEKKDVTEDMLEEATTLYMQKWPLLDAVWCEVWKFAGAYTLDTVKLEDGPMLIEELGKRLTTIVTTSEKADTSDKNTESMLGIMKGLIEQKEGRVLSGKNRDTIKAAVEALNALLDATDKQGEEDAEAKAKADKSFVTVDAQEYFALKGLLKKVATVTGEVLRDYPKQSSK